MPNSHFEGLLQAAMEANTEAMFQVSLGDSHKHAFIKGVREGLTKARDLYKQSVRRDLDGDEDGI